MRGRMLGRLKTTIRAILVHQKQLLAGPTLDTERYILKPHQTKRFKVLSAFT
jgi:hypothetical protein